MVYLQLFWVFVQIGLFSIGGGLAAIPLIQEQVVTEYGWLSLTEFTDLITIAQMTPGPIAINSATFIGIRIGGIFGAMVATFAFVLPSVILVMLLAYIYNKHKQLNSVQALLNSLKPAIVAFIASAGFSILQTALMDTSQLSHASFDYVALVLFLIAFYLLRRYRPNPITVMLGTGVVGAVIYLLMQ